MLNFRFENEYDFSFRFFLRFKKTKYNIFEFALSSNDMIYTHLI